MKKDRSILVLVLLQARNQITVKELASMLEVAVRTIYCDVDNLRSIGVFSSCEEFNEGRKGLIGA